LSKAAILASMLALSGCMNPHDPDAQTHCLIPSMCLDIAANHGNGPGYWGTAAAIQAATPPPPVYVPPPTYPPQQVQIAPFSCTRLGNFVECQ
jgi:hypothetical protein